MIAINRPPAPSAYMAAGPRQQEQKKICTWLATPPTQRKARPKWRPIFAQIPSLKPALLKLFRGKCPYCEQKLPADLLELSFFRPPERACQRIGAAPDGSDHYFWLGWWWPNLYLACPACMRAKDALFPTAGSRVDLTVCTDTSHLYDLCWLAACEQPLLVDPCRQNPNRQLEFREDGTVWPRLNSLTGRVTIDTFSLNRAELCQARRQHIRGQSPVQSWARA
jgi:hypothetical protein